jgi:hypothetical protein
MGANQEGVHASVRAATGTSLDYLSDWHALFTANSVAAGPWNERMLKFLNTNLGTSYARLTDAMNAFAISQGFPGGWNDMNSFTLSAAAAMLAAETQGLAFDFTDDAFFGRDGFYGSAEIKDTGTPANNYSAAPTRTASSLLTYTSPSVKMCMGPSGTLRYGAHNLVTYSEDFSNGAWATGTTLTIAANATTAPDGTLTADSLTRTSTSAAENNIRFTSSQNNSTPYSFSVCAKHSSGSGKLYVRNIAVDSSTTNGVVQFDLEAGTISYTYGSTYSSSASMVSLGNGWYRCSIAGTTVASIGGLNLLDIGVTDGTTAVGGVSGQSVFVWGAQLRRTPSDSTYLSTTTAARYALPLEWSSAGVQQGLLVEEARTNLRTYSQEFDNADHTKVRATISANAIVAPDGTTTADKLVEDGTASNDHNTSSSVTVTTATVYTFSIYAKAAERSWIILYEVGANQGRYFDLANVTTGSVVGVAPITSTITSVGNGWVRCAITVTTSGVTAFPYVYLATGNGGNSYNGDGASGVYIWGHQFELGAFPTSYIQTFASTVTRAADNISLAATAFPSVLTAATFYAEYNLTFRDSAGNSQFAANLTDTAGDNAFRMYGDNGSSSSAALVVSGGATQSNQPRANTLGATNKIALGVTTNDAAFYVNGTAATADTSVTMPTAVDTLWIGGLSSTTGFPHRLGVPLRKLMLIPRRMSNAELQTLTT